MSFIKSSPFFGFLDGGQLYEQPLGNEWPYIRAKGLADFAYGTGPGLRFNTPVGAIRLELGYKLNPPNSDAGFLDRTTIHFSLGEVFLDVQAFRHHRHSGRRRERRNFNGLAARRH